jgi:hypothetical protein
MWAGPAEMTLFAYCYLIQVLCISVVSNKVNPFFTYGLKLLQHFRVSNGLIKNFNEQPKSLDQVIVIWHHNTEHADVFMGGDDGPPDSNFYNHYSLLDVSELQRMEVDLELPYVVHDDERTDSANPITIMTPDGKTHGEKQQYIHSQLDDNLPPVPFAIWLSRDRAMDHNFIIPDKTLATLHFLVLDNNGKGDCFYESILNSDVFQKKVPMYNDTDWEKMYKCSVLI